MKKITALLFILALTLSSCVKQNDIKILSIEGVDVESMSKATMTVKVENLSGTTIKMTRAKFSLMDQSGVSLADLLVGEPVAIPRKSVTDVLIPLRIKINNPMLFFGLIPTIINNPEGYYVLGSVEGRAGAVRKKIDNINIPLSEIITNFGLHKNEMLNLIGL